MLLGAFLLASCRGDGVTGPNFSGPPVPIALQFCAAAKPAWVGYQNGSNAWVSVSQDAGTSYTYSFSVNGGGALAYVLPVGGDASTYGYSTEIVFASAEELAKFRIGACRSNPAGVKTIRGALTGLGTNELGQIYLGGSSSSVISSNGSDATFTLRRVFDASQDLIAVRRSTVSTTGDIVRMVVRRGINPADGAALSSIDFSGAEAMQPVNATLNLTGEVGGLMSVSSSYATAGGSAVLFTGVQTSATSIAFTGAGASAAAGDLHVLAAATQDSPTTSRAVETYFRVAGNRTLNVGPLATIATITAVSGIPNVRFRMDVASNSTYGGSAVAEYSAVGFGPQNRNVEVAMTSGYLGAVPASWSVTMPDFTAVAGYSADYGITTAVGLDYLTITTGGNRQYFIPAADGQTFSYAVHQGTAVENVKQLITPSAITTPAIPHARAALPFDRPWTHAPHER